MGTEITVLLSATFAHCVALNCVWLPLRLTQIGKEVFLNCVAVQEVVIPTELSDTGNRAFCGCEQATIAPLDWSDIGCRQSTMPSLCVTNLKNPSGWSSPRKDPIRTLLTRSCATSTSNIMPVHERLKVGALASVFRKHPGLRNSHEQTQTLLAQTIIANGLPHMELDDSSMISTPPGHGMPPNADHAFGGDF